LIPSAVVISQINLVEPVRFPDDHEIAEVSGI